MLSPQVVTMANCIVGVSVLAMPFCFKQCGVVLATLLLLLSGIMTRTVCYFILKASTITRRRTYELLAYHTFGQAGKLVVEISIIGFLIGTLIAFLVVMGDLGPQILADVFDVENNSSLRSIIMTALSLFVALPLGLLRNIDSLSGVSTVTMMFYIFLVFKILGEGMGPLWSGSFLTRIDYWRPAGVLQCIPIFSMALSCQTQIFGIYESLPDPSLQKMNEVVKKAIDICTLFYICVGFFGYITFCTQNFGGNILLSFGPSWSTQLIKLCFVLSIAFSFPLVIFPCRASLHSLIFRRQGQLHHQIHDITTNYIPESRLKLLTVGIIIFTLIVGLLIPNIELVLGLVGSTTGSVICIIFPSVMFIKVTSKNTTERLLAQSVFFIGVIIMVVTTYATLYAAEQAQTNDVSSSLLVTDNLKSILSKDKDDKNEVDKVIKIDPPISLNNFDTKPSSFDQLVVKAAPVADKPVQSVEKTVTKNVTFVKIKEMPNEMKVKFKSGMNDLDNIAAANKPQQDVAGGGRGIIDSESHIVKELTNNNDIPMVPLQHPENHHQADDQNEPESIKKTAIGDQPIDPASFKLGTNQVKEVNRGRSFVQNVEQQQVKEPEMVKKESDNVLVPDVADDADGMKHDKTLVKKSKMNVNLNLTVHSPDENVVEDKQKLNAEDVLKQLAKHEKEQKKLLAEQKEILAKLKQHQAEDELNQRGKPADSVPASVKIEKKQGLKSQSGGEALVSGMNPPNVEKVQNVPKSPPHHSSDVEVAVGSPPRPPLPLVNEDSRINNDKILHHVPDDGNHQIDPLKHAAADENMGNVQKPHAQQQEGSYMAVEEENAKQKDNGYAVKIVEKPIPLVRTNDHVEKKEQNVRSNKEESQREAANIHRERIAKEPHKAEDVHNNIKYDKKQSEPAQINIKKKEDIVPPPVKQPQVDRDI